MKDKREMLIKELNTLIPGQERDFLEFIEGGNGSGVRDFSKYSLEELLSSFILFEEINNEEEFTKEVMDEVLKIYIGEVNGGGFLGDGVL
jgi:hypothetical protein